MNTNTETGLAFNALGIVLNALNYGVYALLAAIVAAGFGLI